MGKAQKNGERREGHPRLGARAKGRQELPKEQAKPSRLKECWRWRSSIEQKNYIPFSIMYGVMDIFAK